MDMRVLFQRLRTLALRVRGHTTGEAAAQKAAVMMITRSQMGEVMMGLTGIAIDAEAQASQRDATIRSQANKIKQLRQEVSTAHNSAATRVHQSDANFKAQLARKDTIVRTHKERSAAMSRHMSEQQQKHGREMAALERRLQNELMAVKRQLLQQDDVVKEATRNLAALSGRRAK